MVAIQIQQNTNIAKAQILNDFYNADMQLELTMMGEDPQAAWVKAVTDPDNMTLEEAAVMDRYINFNFIQLNRMQRMQDFGLTSGRGEHLNSIMEWHLGNEIGRRWWAHVKSNIGTGAYESQIDEIVNAAKNQNQNMDLLNALMSGDN